MMRKAGAFGDSDDCSDFGVGCHVFEWVASLCSAWDFCEEGMRMREHRGRRYRLYTIRYRAELPLEEKA